MGAMLALSGLPTPPLALAREGLTVGVLSSRNPEVMRERFTPLVTHIGQQLKSPVELQVLDQPSMELALKHQRLDLVITNPSHYLVVRKHNAPTSVIATLVTAEQGVEVNALGGVIVVRPERSDLIQLTDLRGKRVATPGQQFLGGYQTQMLELMDADLSAEDLQLQMVGTHDGVVQAVLNRQADAGFLRTGELESMMTQGRLAPDQLRVINLQRLNGFPFLLSTRLYPEWPVLTMPHVDPHIVRRVASVLLGLPDNHPAMQTAGLHAFTVPADYVPVEELARKLRLPPYDTDPRFTLIDVLKQYRTSATLITALMAALVAVLWVLALQSRRLSQALQRTQMGDSVFRHAQEGILITTPEGRIVDVNASFSRITGYGHSEVLGRTPGILSSGLHDTTFYQHMWKDLLANGRWHGEIWNRRKTGEVFAEVLTITSLFDPGGKLKNHVAVFSDITSQKEHQKQLEHIAHFDALTNLPNRSLLADRLRQSLAQAQRRQTQVALVFLDLDGFKAINDTHGHNAGDHLLQELGRRMSAVLRDGDTLARVGGDEFVVVLVDVPQNTDCQQVLNRLLEAASMPVPLGDQWLQVSASLGVAVFPRDAQDADLLLRQADQAMYQAKRRGKNQYHFFDGESDKASHVQQTQQTELEVALNQGQFELYFQPKVNMRLGEIMGAEALIRWNHPDGQVRTPGSFLPVLEGSQLSVRLDQWVLRQALHHLNHWNAAGLTMTLSVNISARYLQQPTFVADIQTLLGAHATLPPNSLRLEVLETSALQDMEGVANVIRACAALNIEFALDDFGTGYSSLTYLRRLPAQELKIDQSFVRDMLINPEDRTIVEGVISLAKAFGRSVVAEGVETTEHGTVLLQLGCEQAQGYGVARPMPEATFLQWCQTWQPPNEWQQPHLQAHSPLNHSQVPDQCPGK